MNNPMCTAQEVQSQGFAFRWCLCQLEPKMARSKEAPSKNYKRHIPGQCAFSGVQAFFLKNGRLRVPALVLCSCAHLREEPSGAYIKEGQGSGSDLATHRHGVLTILAATPTGNAFPTSSRRAPLSAVSLHSTD